MPLQNRVDPFGDIHAVDARGMFTGNRGIIHDPATKTLLRKRWATKAWIICSCEYKGHAARADGPQQTERQGRLDGAVLPRRGDRARRRASAVLHLPARTGQGVRRLLRDAPLASPSRGRPRIDADLHRDGWRPAGRWSRLDRHGLKKLPDGTMISDGSAAYALRGGLALPWSFHGYGAPLEPSSLDTERLRVLTPATSIAVLAAGFAPIWHPSADIVSA